MSDRRQSPEGKKKEWWLYCIAASFVPVILAFVAPPALRSELMIAGGVLMATGFVLLLARGPSAPGEL